MTHNPHETDALTLLATLAGHAHLYPKADGSWVCNLYIKREWSRHLGETSLEAVQGAVKHCEENLP